ncbi:MAG: hypothetical protein CMN30_33610 [Sandaracinus sp.]|nr:hypothetical protein [Sandaracinus sp.]|tara:strand:- start:6909 stop:7838 length:930 start_codon:yes stop_codon:yes gene_type:complete
MKAWLPLVGLIFLSLPARAQLPAETPTIGEAEAAQEADVQRRLLTKVRPAPPSNRDPEAERALRTLRADRLDRIDGGGAATPRGRGHRFGRDLSELLFPLGLLPDRRIQVPTVGIVDLARIPRVIGDLAVAYANHEVPLVLVLWAEPTLPAEYVWTFAQLIGAYATEVLLVVERAAPGPDFSDVSPRDRATLRRCMAEYRRDDSLALCFQQVLHDVTDGCLERVWGWSTYGAPTRLYLDDGLFQICGDRPLSDPDLFVALIRAWVAAETPVDTEYLLVSGASPPSRPRSLQSWVPELMRAQGISGAGHP